jgi:hypothetical protein
MPYAPQGIKGTDDDGDEQLILINKVNYLNPENSISL